MLKKIDLVMNLFNIKLLFKLYFKTNLYSNLLINKILIKQFLNFIEKIFNRTLIKCLIKII